MYNVIRCNNVNNDNVNVNLTHFKLLIFQLKPLPLECEAASKGGQALTEQPWPTQCRSKHHLSVAPTYVHRPCVDRHSNWSPTDACVLVSVKRPRCGSASSHQCAAAHTCHGGGYAGGVGTKRFDGSTMLGCSMLVTVFLMRAFVACVFLFAWTSTIIYQKLIACLGAAPFRHVTVCKGNNDHQPTMKQHLSQNLETSKQYPSWNDKAIPRSKWSINPRNL